MKTLYHVQDTDRAMYVVASSWQEAVDRWKAQIREENESDPCDDEEPEGVTKIAEAGEDFPELLLEECALSLSKAVLVGYPVDEWLRAGEILQDLTDEPSPLLAARKLEARLAPRKSGRASRALTLDRDSVLIALEEAKRVARQELERELEVERAGVAALQNTIRMLRTAGCALLVDEAGCQEAREKVEQVLNLDRESTRRNAQQLKVWEHRWAFAKENAARCAFDGDDFDSVAEMFPMPDGAK